MDWVLCQAGGPQRERSTAETSGQGRCGGWGAAGHSGQRFDQPPAATGTDGADEWNWDLFLLSTGSSLQRSGKKAVGSLSGRGSSTWVLCADRGPTWSQDFDTMGQGCPSVCLAAPHEGSSTVNLSQPSLGPAPSPLDLSVLCWKKGAPSFYKRNKWDFGCEKVAQAPADTGQGPYLNLRSQPLSPVPRPATLCSGSCVSLSPLCPLWSPCVQPGGGPSGLGHFLCILNRCERLGSEAERAPFSPGGVLNKHVLCQLGARRPGTQRGGGARPAQNQSLLALDRALPPPRCELCFGQTCPRLPLSPLSVNEGEQLTSWKCLSVN